MKRLFLLLAVIVLFNCSESSDVEPLPDPVAVDVWVASSESSILWLNWIDLTQKVADAIRYDYGTVRESVTEKKLTYNADTTAVTATIAIKAAYKNDYYDPDMSNNSVSITLVKDTAPPEPRGVALKADGPGGTYELITSVLAPGANPIETPDCSHPTFGDHIDEIFDNDLNTNVFRFHIHVDPDNDRCIKFDRQRNEIKSYDKSPDKLLGVESEKVVYKWKFKLQSGFQSSPNFTHIHQLKSVGGNYESMPMYTLTTRKGSPDQLELRYAETDSQTTLKKTDLSPFVDTWLEVTETITYDTSGSYEIEIKKVSDNSILFEYANNAIMNWRPGADFVRPKWGIYRSLINKQDLQDEEVLFADFNIMEIEE